MKLKAIFIYLFTLPATFTAAQEEDGTYDMSSTEPYQYIYKVQIMRYKKPLIENGDTMLCYLLPDVWIYPPMKFKSEKQRRKYNKLVHNVKKVLPLAKQVNQLVMETYEVLEQMPDKKTKEEHIKAVEKDIKRQYTPEMKKLTYSQGKLLIKLVYRECNSSSYQLIQAFLGPIRAGFYQAFAALFGASLTKKYDAEGVDKYTERIVRQVEAGQL